MCVRQLWKITLLVVFITLLGPVRQVGAEPPAPQDEADTAAGPSWGEPIVWDGTATLGSPTSMGASHLQVAAAVMSQDFEGAWPAPGWRLVDASSTDGGEYMWGKRTCYPRTGTYGGWSVGGGQQGAALPCSADYPNNARTWAIYGPFDLSQAGAASLIFHLRGITAGAADCPWDRLFVGSSTDGSSFSGSRYCGNWTGGNAGNGYYQDALDLSSRLGQSQVWIAFHFYSNSSGTSAGFTIDDITLNIDATGSKIFLPGIVNNWSAPEPSPTPGPPPSSDLPCLYAVNWWRDDSPPYGLLHSTYAPACLMPESPTFQPDYGPQGQWIGYTASLSRPSKPDFDMDADYIFNSGGGVEGANVTKTYVGGYVYQMQITRFCPKVGQLTGYKVKVSAPPYNGREETVGSCP